MDIIDADSNTWWAIIDNAGSSFAVRLTAGGDGKDVTKSIGTHCCFVLRKPCRGSGGGGAEMIWECSPDASVVVVVVYKAERPERRDGA